MTIHEAKKALAYGHTLELIVPAHHSYLEAMYHILVNTHKEYQYSVFYRDVSVKWEPLFATADWELFLKRLPATLQNSTEWVVL